MATQNMLPTGPETTKRRSSVLLILAFFAGILVCWGALSLVALKSASSNLWSALMRRTQIDVSQATVVNRIQQLQRLETVVYTMDKVVMGKRENTILPDFLAGDKLLLLVHGEGSAELISRRSSLRA